MNLETHQKDFFHKNGYIILKSSEWFELKNKIQSELLRVTEEILKKHDYWSKELSSFSRASFQDVMTTVCEREQSSPAITISNVLYEYFPKTPFMYRTLANETLLQILQQLGIGEAIPSTVPVTRIDRPGNTFYLTPWHQDFWYSLVSLNSITVWFPLIPLDRTMGLLEVIPGTHDRGLWKFREHQGYEPFEAIIDDDLLEKKIEVEVGTDEILVFYQTLLHRSQVNRSKTPRISVQLRYNDLTSSKLLKNSFTPVHSEYVKNTQLELLKNWKNDGKL